jgi:hypothetical protein
MPFGESVGLVFMTAAVTSSRCDELQQIYGIFLSLDMSLMGRRARTTDPDPREVTSSTDDGPAAAPATADLCVGTFLDELPDPPASSPRRSRRRCGVAAGSGYIQETRGAVRRQDLLGGLIHGYRQAA